jgi:hypothetical protein
MEYLPISADQGITDDSIGSSPLSQPILTTHKVPEQTLRVCAERYIRLGAVIQETKTIFKFNEHGNDEEYAESDRQQLKDGLEQLLTLCGDLELKVASDLVRSKISDPPKTEAEYNMLASVVYSELRTRIFVFLRPQVAKYYNNDNVFGDQAASAFPSCRNELWDASNALAAGLWTASVFYSMRAAEIGVRLLARDLGVSFPDKTIEQAEWAQLLDQSDSKIKAIGKRSKSDQREKDQRFYSTAAAEFRYFKDGWRVRVAHAKATYTEEQATKIFEHTKDFFETLAERLKE